MGRWRRLGRGFGREEGLSGQALGSRRIKGAFAILIGLDSWRHRRAVAVPPRFQVLEIWKPGKLEAVVHVLRRPDDRRFEGCLTTQVRFR